MKIAISATGKDLDSMMDLRFGRAKGFIIYNVDEDSSSYIDNIQNYEATQGAGVQAAQNVVNQKVDILITGNCGPKAFRALQAAKVKIYLGTEGTVRDVIMKYKNNELHEADKANVEGHWM